MMMGPMQHWHPMKKNPMMCRSPDPIDPFSFP
jgi:hypothetical protein